MSVELREMINFHLTGKRAKGAADSLAGYVPALLAPYTDLKGLRYDFPLILVEGASNEAFVDTLTGVVNRLLRDIAPEGNDGELLRQHVLRLEARMRELASGNPGVPLAELWESAGKMLLAECDGDDAEWFGNSIATARFALRGTGLVVDCDAQLPARLITHAWQRLGAGGGLIAEEIKIKIIELSRILKVDELKREPAKTPQKLRASMGKRHAELFDFDRMAELVYEAPGNVIPEARKRRLREALDVLVSQRFFPSEDRADRHDFVFDGLAGALKAYENRLEEMSAIVRALEIAELELRNAYREDVHDSYFERFAPQSLTREDIAQFPSYLVCLHERDCTSRDLARLIEIVSCEMPIKVLIHVSDPLGSPSPVDGLPHKGTFAQQLASTFMTGNAFVLQSPVSNLYRQRDDIRKCLEYAGPGIISIYAPCQDDAAAMSSYAISAAALESRVFPAFSYDPAAGEGLANRFDLSHNPNVEADWPVHEFVYEDDDLQVVRENLSFTPADFAILHPEYSDHFVLAGADTCPDDLISIDECVNKAGKGDIEAVPGIAVVDQNRALYRLVVDEKLIRVVLRSRDRWHALQDLADVHGSSANTESQPSLDETEPPAGEPVDTTEADRAPPETSADSRAEPVDEPFIETPRCTTCDECTKRNDRMFAYDENRQAYIKDPDAGTYRELVEAAEMCQVAIIHPGKPRNPNEPGLDQLIDRAKPFND